jgi:hypothetical protein
MKKWCSMWAHCWVTPRTSVLYRAVEWNLSKRNHAAPEYMLIQAEKSWSARVQAEWQNGFSALMDTGVLLSV